MYIIVDLNQSLYISNNFKLYNIIWKLFYVIKIVCKHGCLSFAYNFVLFKNESGILGQCLSSEYPTPKNYLHILKLSTNQ